MCPIRGIFDSTHFVRIYTRTGSFDGIAVDITRVRSLNSLESFSPGLFKRACPVCLDAIEEMELKYLDQADTMAKMRK